MFNLQDIINNTTQAIIEVPPGDYDIGNVTVSRDIRLIQPTMTTSKLKGTLHFTSRGQSIIDGVRLDTSGSDYGMLFDFAFNTHIKDCLIENCKIPIGIKAGVSYLIDHNYLLGSVHDIEIKNIENPDQGDGMVCNNTFDDPTGGNKLSSIHQISGGGLRIINNKLLSGHYGYLGEFEGNTSDLLFSNNSAEGQSSVCIAMRVASGSFENVVISGNQFAANCSCITVNGVNRGIVTGNVVNNSGKPFFQSNNASNWTNVNNQG